MRTIRAHEFTPRSQTQPLGDEEIHVWFFADWRDARDSAESPHIRRWLAEYDNRDESGLHIGRDSAGKPYVVDSRLQFNLSHSRGALALAIARDAAVGVDIENREHQRRALDLARRWFHPTEFHALAALDESMRQAAFLRLWSCKEALLKATGDGIARGLARAVFCLQNNGEVAGFATSNAIEGYNAVQLEPAVGLIGALAWRGGNKLVKVFRYTQ